MSSRVIAIGDVHGCVAALRALLDTIELKADDTLVMLGDCVDRGPNSRDVIDELLRLREACRLVPILGNHEEMMLNYLDERPQPDDWLDCGGAATLASYGGLGDGSSVPGEHIDFIRTWGDCFETDSHFFVHANYEPSRPLTNQHWQSLRWQTLKFGLPAPHCSGRTAIVGHTAQKNSEVLNAGYLVCIDTYCWGGGWLTALDATTGHIWQADRDGRLRQS